MKQFLLFAAFMALVMGYACQKDSYPSTLTSASDLSGVSDRGDTLGGHHGHHPGDSLGHHCDSLHVDSLHIHHGLDSLHHHLDSLGHPPHDSLNHPPHDTTDHPGGPGGPHGGGGHGHHGHN